MSAILESVAKPPICTDCDHIATSSTTAWENFKCRSPENVIDKELNLVNGELVIRRKVELCKDARKDETFCGNAGVWFKLREFTVIDKKAPIIKERERTRADEL